MFCLLENMAGQADERFRQANEAFQQNDFEKAVQLYEELTKAGYRSVSLEYNLGNAWYRLSRPGKAILHFERALLLAPDDEDIQYNIALVRQQLKDEIEPLPVFFFSYWWSVWRTMLSSKAWGIMALLLWWVGFACLVLWKLGKARKFRKMGFIVGISCLILSLLPFSLALSRMGYENDPGQAVILEETASLRSAPDEAGTEVMLLHEGTKVSLNEKINEWWNVHLVNGEKGWLQDKVMEKI
jgi:tetratricopeptide (TPR) repeat protein